MRPLWLTVNRLASRKTLARVGSGLTMRNLYFANFPTACNAGEAQPRLLSVGYPLEREYCLGASD